ncbi:MAG: hypothetical protein HGA23_00705, partial [Bacteroidales bacterium]|nr:hypothetical protein [Bacteroidales bacterium]
MKNNLLKGLTISLIVIAASLFNGAKAQVDTTQVVIPDTTIQEKGKEEKKDKKEDKKRKDEFIPYVGVNFNQISDLETDIGIGYHLGFNYKRGKFFYWQVGARFNNAVYKLTNALDTTDNVGIRSIDIPITGGINFLSFTNRIVALRVFVSAVPGFALGVGENDLGYTKDGIETFCLYGQG